MARSYYSEYVKHAMRYYSRFALNSGSEKPKFKSEADKRNWYACDGVLNTLPSESRTMLITIYADGDTIPDNVYQYALSHKMEQDAIWNAIYDIERKIAKRRGLI